MHLDTPNIARYPNAPAGSRGHPHGFTLIELMIVVAIIGILAAVAIPAYMDHTLRVQVSEGINLSADAKTALATYFQERGTFPTDNSEAALPDANRIRGDYVTAVSISGADISIHYGNKASPRISGETITISAASTAGSLTWSCASGGVIEPRLLPGSCD